MIFAVLPPVAMPLFGCTLLVPTVQSLEIGRTAIFLNISKITKLATEVAVAVAVAAMFFKGTAQLLE